MTHLWNPSHCLQNPTLFHHPSDSLQASSPRLSPWQAPALHHYQDEQVNGAVPTIAAASCLAPIPGPQSTLSAPYSMKPANYEAGSAGKSWRSSSGQKKATLQISGPCQMYGRWSQISSITLLTVQAYFTLLGHHHPNSTLRCARPSAQKTLANMLDVHDELLGALYRVIPFAEYDQQVAMASHRPPAARVPLHTRWHSVDIVSGHPSVISPNRGSLATAVRQNRRSLNLSRSEEAESIVLRCAPQVVASVAALFKTYVGFV
jgi:hypothetical protein